MASDKNLEMRTAHQAATNESFIFILLQFLHEEKLSETAHRLERDSKLYFDMRFFEEILLEGKWDEAEWYLNGYFTNALDGNRYALKLIFEIRKQKYLEALDRHDVQTAVGILHNEIKGMVSPQDKLYKDMAHLLSLENFRENQELVKWGDTEKARKVLCGEMRRTIMNCPDLKDKLQFPTIQVSRLKTLINHSLTWQHYLCNQPLQNPTFNTIFFDHNCTDLIHARNATQMLRPALTFNQNYLPSPSRDIYIRPPVPNRPTHTAETSQRPKKLRSAGQMNPELLQRMEVYEALPKNVVMTLHQGSPVVSMDFNPVRPSVLLVGTSSGEISIWNLSSKEKIHHREFMLWNDRSLSPALKEALGRDSGFSVRRVVWHSEGGLFAVAHSNHLVHLYRCNKSNELLNHLEIDAHVGGVNDLAFSQPGKQVHILTCGDDMTIKVWSAVTGLLLHVFKGHAAPIFSIWPQCKGNFHFVISSSIDGRVKIWTYDKVDPQVEFATPGSSATSLAYTSDGTRLFSCGTSREGDSYLLEWNETNGGVIRCYNGLTKQSFGIIQFDLANNKILAAGDDSMVKFWDMNHIEPLSSVTADGGLNPLPRVKFNKTGSLLAVTAQGNNFKILANKEGDNLLSLQKPRAAGSDPASTPIIILNEDSSDNENEVKDTYPIEINEPSQCQSFRLPDKLPKAQVHKLVYTSSGDTILALSSNAVHKVWKWKKCESNPSGKVNTRAVPILWMPSHGTLMVNEIGRVESESHLFALTKNDSYIVSSSGGDISLFSVVNSKRMVTFLPPPPVATAFAFHPKDSNKIVIGMDDSTIIVYEPRNIEVESTLIGHEKTITGLAFSAKLNILVSSGEDNQLCVWRIDTWEKLGYRYLELPREVGLSTKTRVEFHCDEVELLVIHPTLLVIYDASKLEIINQWVPTDSWISNATYSCTGEMIFACLTNGTIKIFTKTLQLRCQINPKSYLSLQSMETYGLSIAAHRSEPNQFAVGMTDGAVHVLEPLESQGQWGSAPPLQIPANENHAVENRAASMSFSGSSK